MGKHLERGFAMLAAGGFFLAVAMLGVAPTTGPKNDSFTFTPDVPDEYTFTEPTQDGNVRIGSNQFETLQGALGSAEPGDTLLLRGRFEGPVTVNKSGLTLTGASDSLALIEGKGEGNVLTVNGRNVTIRRLWVRNSGRDAAENDTGIWVDGANAKVVDSRVTAITFGIWVNGVDEVQVANTTIVGRESVRPLSYRGNGIQIWKTEDSRFVNNRITDVRDGLYYSWASDVVARGNTMWDLRYGVHYMYSDDCTLRKNLSFNNDSGYALMVSQGLKIVNNTAVNNTGTSGHGILVKDIEDTKIRGNTLVRNETGLYIYNSLGNVITGNLVLENKIGVHLTAGSVREEVHGNSFIANGEAVRAVIGEQVAWNRNYWSEAPTADIDEDGISDIRYQPAGIVERLVAQKPLARLFADSPAFAAIRLAESSIPVIESPGVVDHHPLVSPPHNRWKRYYE